MSGILSSVLLLCDDCGFTNCARCLLLWMIESEWTRVLTKLAHPASAVLEKSASSLQRRRRLRNCEYEMEYLTCTGRERGITHSDLLHSVSMACMEYCSLRCSGN